ncbi:circadian clock protein KaiC [Haliangium ochraceum]|uniref:non-specific serine/threonine protein kinase n=1 Tax=Haliangium ochraceum (strain DSM 14365 / JCM 11303 / SMP-2) TaxID=502025 RepID=D0LSC3_HALO1|nr:circadian clock protein KaiC [Haliangium ochraceum]ACY15622.1 putative circadian clock protein, KaiC [Haliangium ochraceum DSM 14365]
MSDVTNDPSSGPPPKLAKASSGTDGLDEILSGGLPRGRPTLVCGAAGCGKTLMGMQFLVRGALEYGEPGAFIAFEERVEDLHANVASLGFNLAELESRGLLSIDHIQVDPSTIIESGDYDLSGLFIRLGLAIDSVGAKRVVIDTLETLFGGLSNYAIVRAELRRLFDWLKERGVTAIITAERGDNALTRYGLEEYVSDCVIILDHRVVDQVSTRRLRVVKYRGSVHGTNEYPFLIDEDGISVLPITSAGLDHQVSDERVPSGVARLDAMLGGAGYYRGSTVLLSGTAGAGKSSLAAYFANAVCGHGERALYFSFEESPTQILRNTKTIGLDLQRWIDGDLLRFVAARPTAHGIETHLALLHRHIRRFEPAAVIIDPVSNLLVAGNEHAAAGMLVRLIDFLKARGITALLTSLTQGGEVLEATNTAISSIVDTWLLLKTIELAGERNKGIYVLKSRGMAHSNQIREFAITSRGIELTDVYVGLEGVLTGSARAAQEAREREQARRREREIELKRRQLVRLEALHREQMAKLTADFESQSAELQVAIEHAETAQRERLRDLQHMAESRQADDEQETP